MATTDVPDATSAAPGVSSAGKRRAASASSRVSSLSQRMAEKARAVASAAAEQAEKKTAEMAEMKRALAEKADEKTSSGGAKTLTKTQMRAALAAERRAAAEAEGGRRMPARTESGLKGGAPRGQAATDGVLIIGDELVGVDGEALGHRPLAKVLPRGKKEYTFTVRRDANRPVAVDAAHEAPLAVAAQATSDDSAASGRPPAQRKKAAQRRKPAQRGGGTASEPSAAPPAGGGGGLETWLLQKALEVSMVYRQPIKASATLFERIEQSERLTTFMTELRELSDETKQPLDVVFQCLMQALADSGRAVMVGGAGFDSQGGTFGNPNADDFVPMHQAKVLDRSEALQHADAAIRELAGGRLPWLVDSSDLLRKLLRVKVEDGNDLLMAIDTVNEVHSFWQKLRLHAEQTDEDHFVLYQRLVAF